MNKNTESKANLARVLGENAGDATAVSSMQRTK